MTPDDFKAARLSLGWTTASAAEALGLTAEAVSQYESGAAALPRSTVILLESYLTSGQREPWPDLIEDLINAGLLALAEAEQAMNPHHKAMQNNVCGGR